jgi:hypothetical protein
MNFDTFSCFNCTTVITLTPPAEEPQAAEMNAAWGPIQSGMREIDYFASVLI